MKKRNSGEVQTGRSRLNPAWRVMVAAENLGVFPVADWSAAGNEV
jgi:hypothetical protein